MPARSQILDLWAYIDTENGPIVPHLRTRCWIWTGNRSVNQGYGHASLNSRTVYIHRYMKGLHNISGKVCCLHLCDIPSCVRPIHLKRGSKKQNARDSLDRGRNPHKRKLECPKGHLYDKQNTYFDKRGFRSCRECVRVTARKFYRNCLRKVGKTPLKRDLNGRVTQCINGHNFTLKNTYVDEKNFRHCRECRKIRAREYRRKKRYGFKGY